MKHRYGKLLTSAVFSALFLFSSCHSTREITSRYAVSKASGSMITIDSSWDEHPDPQATALLKPYKEKVDLMMYEVIGKSAMKMEKGTPESLLSNLIASVLQQSATQLLGRPADMGLINMGGLRSILSKGDITVGAVYELLPFENSLCVLTIRGSHLKRLFQSIAFRRGEGVSGIELKISQKGELVDARVGGKPLDENRFYTVATVDYLADGNERMEALLQAEKRECPRDATLRGLFMDYVREQTAQGKEITSKLDGRIVILQKQGL